MITFFFAVEFAWLVKLIKNFDKNETLVPIKRYLYIENSKEKFILEI
jgi:hypothetical protein